jgi:hypothetical protein
MELTRPGEDPQHRLHASGRLGHVLASHPGEWIGASSARDSRSGVPFADRERQALDHLLPTDEGLVRLAEAAAA